MNISNIIEAKIDRLVLILDTDGVLPSGIVDNVFDSHYESMTVKKQGEYLVSEVVFYEEIGFNEKVKTKLLYTYTMEKKLVRIEEIKGRKRIIEWDREIVINETLNDVYDLIKEHYSEVDYQIFKSNLPAELKDIFSQIAKSA